MSGVWHGAAYNFVIWGGLHGLLQVTEKLIYGDKLKRINSESTPINVIRIIITFTLVSFAWIFFRVDSGAACTIIGKIFTSPGMPFIDATTLVYGFLCLVIVVLKDYVDEYHEGKVKLYGNRLIIVRWASYIATIMMILLFGVFQGSSFIYFQF